MPWYESNTIGISLRGRANSNCPASELAEQLAGFCSIVRLDLTVMVTTKLHGGEYDDLDDWRSSKSLQV